MPQVRGGGALRALAPEPALLGAAESLRQTPARGFASSTAAFAHAAALLRKGVTGQQAQRLCGAEKRRACGRARKRAHPPLTCRICLSAVSGANVASYAAGRKTEHRRAVRPPAGPPQRSGACCPVTPLRRSVPHQPTHARQQRACSRTEAESLRTQPRPAPAAVTSATRPDPRIPASPRPATSRRARSRRPTWRGRPCRRSRAACRRRRRSRLACRARTA